MRACFPPACRTLGCASGSCNPTGGDCFEGSCVCRLGYTGAACDTFLFGMQLAALPVAVFPPGPPPSPLPPPRRRSPPPLSIGSDNLDPIAGQMTQVGPSGAAVVTGGDTTDFLLRGQVSSSSAPAPTASGMSSATSWLVAGLLCGVVGLGLITAGIVFLIKRTAQTRLSEQLVYPEPGPSRAASAGLASPAGTDSEPGARVELSHISGRT